MIQRFLPLIFSPRFFQKVFAFGLIIWIGYILSDFLVLFFITFLFAYLFLEVGSWLANTIHSWGLHNKRSRASELALKYSNTNIIVSILYVLFIAILIWLFVNIIPQIIREIGEFIKHAPGLALQVEHTVDNFQKELKIDLGLEKFFSEIINAKNLQTFGQTTLSHLTNTGVVLTKFLIGLILSYVFVIERHQIGYFLARMKGGNFAFLYNEYSIIAQKVGGGFGIIFKAQSLIALTNAILTTIGLLIISFFHGGEAFPFIFTLSLIVLIFGFIPVFGTFISGIPIIIIAYGYGGGLSVILCVSMIAIVHAVEAYYLNPRIVSSYVHFPVFITFLILLVAEHFFGLIGLLIGVPIFVIFLSFFDDFDGYISDIKHAFYGKIPPKTDS